MAIRQAMILAAGMGKRLQPLTLTVPKPLINVQGKPILAYGLERLGAENIKKIVVNTHYLASQIHSYLSEIKDLDLQISHEEEEALETGGGILKALPHFQGNPFLSINADVWWEETGPYSLLHRLMASWDEATMDALLVLIPKQNAIGFQNKGDYHLEPDSRLRYRDLGADAPYIYGGIQLLHPRLFEGHSIKPFPLPPLYHKAQEKKRLFGIVHAGKWCDIGTLEALSQLQDYMGNVI